MGKMLLQTADVFVVLVILGIVYRTNLILEALNGNPLFEPTTSGSTPVQLLAHLAGDILAAGVVLLLMLLAGLALLAPRLGWGRRVTWLAEQGLAFHGQRHPENK